MPINLSPVNPPETHIAIAIDCSGSMEGLSQTVVRTFNNILEELKVNAVKTGQKVFVYLYTFGGSVQRLLNKTPVELVPHIQQDQYRADGGTPMFEACWKAFSDLNSIGGADSAKLLTVLTDGEENGSHHQFKTSFLNQLKVTNHNWSFVFSVPDGLVTGLKFIGIPAGNIQVWNTTTKGLETASTAISSGYANYLNMRSKGVTSTKGFFELAVDKDAARAAKKALDDVSVDFKEMAVRTQDPKVLQEFVEARGLRFMKGRAFYQLTKAEKVQPHKEVLLKELRSGAIYGGHQARQILGLPEYQEVKVKPADFGDWEIFVQSTSNNRKLMPGTKLLWLR